mmetsp:Transcript_2986/g.6868  ORF Transcript_2986/g.6868 Transcript_2986/m.6868 type:complete len:772 (-) Transcript_2986:550-2865(-)|eukprot:CAMPEP_0178988344 /NCGR_PEP_ID=MMETSP0795-20121207/3761_1 /TAXON_ID=88552 /ORGANISM="Amoebophrya sp., Strain Ameob2" /LENGTH=771 /DNA_ID=CAMNT_0020679613 /DNA_START=240 /DNA_END=2555 /DNA_ORIENTATION=-
MVSVQQDDINQRVEFFSAFLENSPEHQEELLRIFSEEKGTYRLDVNLRDLEKRSAGMLRNLLEKPSHYIPCFEAGLQTFCMESARFEKFQKNPMPVRIGLCGQFGRNYVTPRGLHSGLVTQLVCVEGVVTSASSIQSRLTQSIYYCDNQGSSTQTRMREHRDNTSLMWQDIRYNAILKEDADGFKWKTEFGFCEYKDQQRLVIQEAPENAPTGQIPVSVVAMVEQDMVDSVKPGDRVRVVGVYKAFPKVQNGVTSGIFPMRIVCNSVKKIKEHFVKLDLQLKDTKAIREISKRKDFFNLLSRSFAPSISGNESVKKGLLLLAVGGAEKNFENGTHLRGDISVLLVGDPSCGKSQMLRFVMNISPLAISTTGRGSSGVGLTAAVKVDQKTGERSLEAGAMVLGDRGIVLIDEFDKMGLSDRVAIHEVMEQQTVSISKAGIQSTLNARCSVLAAANPVYSTWDDSLSLHQNIALPDSLLSRFDLIYVMKDEITQTKDRKISDQVLRQLMYRDERAMAQRDVADVHDSTLQTNVLEDPSNKKESTVFQQNHTSMSDGQTQDILTLDFLKKYLKFCKDREEVPQLSRAACEKIGVYYAELRQLMKSDTSSQGFMAVTTRTLEAMIRLSTAHAKLRLAKEVTVEDVEVIRELIFESRSLEPKIAEAAAADGTEESDPDAMDVDEDDLLDEDGRPKPKRQRAGGDDEMEQQTYNEFKRVVFNLFTAEKRMDVLLDKLRQKLNEDSPHIDELIYTACMNRLIKEKKIMLEGETIYLTA